MKHKIIAIIMMLLPIHALLGFSGSGSGTSGDPYLVSNATDLVSVASNLGAGVYFKQTADIALSSNWTTPIGSLSTKFLGSYDGDGHKITGLSITATGANYGLFGYIGSGGAVKNLGIVNAFCNASTFSTIGILVGCSTGATIENCYTSGALTGSGSLYGGLVGNLNPGTITNCYSSANVTSTSTNGTSNVGGLVGQATTGATIQNCYATGTVVNSSGRAGGFIGAAGLSTPSITNCYSTGSVTATTKGGFIGFYNTGTFTDCYFDSNTAGTSNPYGAYQTSAPTGITAKTTTEMQTKSTFSGWDFTSTWEIITGYYPRLKSIPDPALPVELSSFSAAASNNSATLAWKTATEVNNYGFNIERRLIEKVDGRSETVEWRKIGFVAGNGTSNTENAYSFSDANVSSGTYAYRLKQIDNGGTYKYSSETEVTISIPKVFALNQNYPNPFNPMTTFTFTLAQDGYTTLKIYNVLGKEVATLVNGEMKAGMVNTVTFNASRLSSGVYFYKLQAGNYTAIKKLVLMR